MIIITELNVRHQLEYGTDKPDGALELGLVVVVE